ncbi:MAG: tetratricopeptide repeat protein, partial [Bacteroidota bacterium]
ENDRGAIHLNRKKVRYDLTEKDVLGRAEELEKLLTLLKDSKSLVLVSGLGGIGKTTLVNYYLSRYQAAYKHIGWVSCTGDFKNDVLASLDNEDALGKDESSDLEARFQNKLLQLQKLSGNNLLVIDNINTPAEAQEVLQYKDRFPNNFQLLMTARVALQGYPTHQIGVLEEADAIDLFKKHYTFKKGDSEDQLQTLLKHIGRHTLVIEMLAKGMAMSGRMNLARMSERIREKGLQSIKVEASTQRAGGQNKRLNEFVAEVLDLSFQDINEENWLLLQQLVVLPPVAHEFDLLIHLLGCDEEEAQDQLDAQLSRLQKRGLLEYQAENIQLHPVLREVVLEKSNLEYEHLAIIVERLDEILYYDNNNPKHQLADRQPLIIYGDAIVEQVQDLEEEKVSELLDDLGGVYEEFGQYHKAAKLRERALAIAEAIFEPNHRTVIVRLSHLAIVYRQLGLYEKSAQLAEKSLRIAKEIFESGHSEIAVRQSNLANVYLNLGRYEEAANLLEGALQSALDNFGDKHPNVAVSQSNLANVYRNLGRYEEAANLLETALQSDLDNFGDKHPNVAVSQSNLANVYVDLGRYEEAANLLETALQSDLDSFGDKHPNVATRYNNLALVYDATKDYPKAVECLSLALEIVKIHFETGHPRIDLYEENLRLVIKEGAEAGDAYCQELWEKWSKGDK